MVQDANGRVGRPRSHAVWRAIIARATRLWVVALVLSVPCRAVEMREPGLVATVFSSVPSATVAIPGSRARSYTSFAYTLARTVSPRIDDLVEFDRTGVELRRGTIGIDAAVLYFGSGEFVGRLFAVDRALPTAAPDGVYEIRPDRTVVQFSTLGGGNPDPSGMAFGRGTAWGTDMYVANPTAGSSDARVNRAIVRLNSAGEIVDQVATHPDGPWYLALPDNASLPDYGDYLYFTLLSSNRLMRVNSAGVVETFATFDSGESPVDLVFGRGGALGHSLYVTVNNTADASARRLARVRADGTIETVATGLRGFNMDVDPDSGDLFIADESGGLVRISALAPQARIDIVDLIQQVAESAGTIGIRIRRTGGGTTPINVDYATRDITATAGTSAANGDYRATAGTLTFTSPGEIQTIEIPIFDDEIREDTEEFAIELSNPTGGAVAGTFGSVLILDDDGDFDLGLSLFEFTGRDSTPIALGGGVYQINYFIRIAAVGFAVTPARSIQISIPDEIFEFISAESRLVEPGGLGPRVGSYLASIDRWFVPQLLPGQRVELHLTVRHSLQGSSGRNVTMRAQILDNLGDTNPVNDTLTVRTPVGGFDLAVDARTDPGPRSPYDFIAFDVSIRRVPQNNVSPWVYPSDVELILEVSSEGDAPQPNTRFLPERTTGVTGCTPENVNRRLRCPVDIGREALALPIAVRVVASPDEGRTLTVTAQLETSTFDPNPDNNRATAAVTVSRAFFDAEPRQPFEIYCSDSARAAGQCGNVPLLGDLHMLQCFIATAAYGSPLDSHVASLRQFRDRWLLTNAPGRAFVAWYYRTSPPVARWMSSRSWARAIVRGLLWPIVVVIEHSQAAGLSMLLALVGYGGFALRRRRLGVCP